jgi:hypothetical protein
LRWNRRATDEPQVSARLNMLQEAPLEQRAEKSQKRRYSRLEYFEPVFYESFINRMDSQVITGEHRAEDDMKIQVNSDKTIAVDARLISFVEGEVRSLLGRFAIRLTRVEIHLSDVDNNKRGQPDKRCLIEVRPTGARPLSASAQATKVANAVSHALGKIQRLLTTFFGRRGRTAAAVSAPVAAGNKAAASKASLGTKMIAEVKKVAFEKPTKLGPRGPKKKGIYQARRKSWPAK